MTSTCVASVGLCAIRVALLSAAGAPLTGANNGLIVESAMSLQVTLTTDDGDDKTKKNGCGRLMVSLKGDKTLSGIEFAAKYCHLDADLISLKTGASVITSGGNPVGLELPSVGSVSAPVCLEGWSKAIDVDHQIIDATTGPAATYIHWVWPYTQWVEDAHTLEDDAMEVDLSGVGRENPAITVNGPFNDWPSYVVAHGGITKLGGWFYDELPTITPCERIAVTSAAS